jgi:hypothetical protein
MSAEFVFCKRCGAVTRPGVCTNCGFDMYKDLNVEENNNSEINSNNESVSTESNTSTSNNSIYQGGNFVSSYSDTNTNNATADNTVNNVAPTRKSKSKGKGWIVGLAIGIPAALAVLLVCIIAILAVASPLLIKYVIPTSVSNNIYNSLNKNNNSALATLIPVPEEEEEDDEDEDLDIDYSEIFGDDPTTGSGYDPTAGSGYAYVIDGMDVSADGFDQNKFDGYVASANEYSDNVVDDTDKKDVFANGVYDSYLTFPAEHGEHDRDSYPTPYLTSLDECYEECADYSVERHIIKYEGTHNGVLVNCTSAYYTITSDTIDFTDVNKKLKEQALIGLYNFFEDSSKSSTYSYTIYSDAIITYNNDEVLSIVYDYTSYDQNNKDLLTVHAINVDVKNGKVFDNTKILDMDDAFSKFFVDRSNIQNSYVSALNSSSTSDITKVLNDDKSLIMFFTPFGIEVGIQYKYMGSYGWVTITINDFDKYMSGTYNFNTDWGKKNYDVYQYEKDNGITPKTSSGGSTL